MTRYWCHVCNSFVHVQADPLRCVTCDGDFVEVVPEEEPVQPQAASQPAPNANFYGGDQQGNAMTGSLFDMFSNMLGGQAANLGPQAVPPGGQPQANANPFAYLQQHIQVLQQRIQQQQQHMGQHAQQQPNQGAPGFVQYQIPLNQLFNLGGQGAPLQNLFGAFGNQQQFGDYVSDAGMQGILDRLFRQHQGSQVSASKTIFDKLAKKKFTKEDASGECAICKCDWAENDEGVELPCHHVFHEDCIGQWFKSSNQCPMCRFEVETDDPEYEKVRKEKLAEQELNNILRTSSSTAVPSTTSTDSTATPSSSAAPPTSESTASTSSSNSTSQASSALTRDEREALLDEVISICSDDSSSMDLSTEYVSCDDSSQPISISSHSPIGTPVETRRATKKKKERDPSSEVD